MASLLYKIEGEIFKPNNKKINKKNIDFLDEELKKQMKCTFFISAIL